MPNAAVHQKRRPPADPPLHHSLAFVAGVAAITAAIAGGLGYCDPLTGVSPDRLVTVYRTHGCSCAFRWSRALESEGYVVRLQEVESLQPVRHRLGTPAQLKGCHVAKYLDYFVEGHVLAADLRRLYLDHPNALGVAAGATGNGTGTEDVAPAVLFDLEGHQVAWRDTAPIRS